MIRYPAVAQRFYPADPQELTHLLDSLIPAGTTARPAQAVVMPHAGYIYSGAVAGETIAAVEVPETVIVLGPNHHGLGAPAALTSGGHWAMPLGQVAINRELAALILAHCPEVENDPPAHRDEHSLEVLVPFLQYRQPRLTIVPLCLSHLDLAQCLRLGQGLAAAVREFTGPVLLAASSDMTHYQSRAKAGAQDRLAIERVLALDPAGLYQTVADHRISMCGVIPTVIALVAALSNGADQARLVRYTDSGAVSGDTEQVVGYAGFIIG